MLAIVSYELRNSTLLTVFEYLKIITNSITPFEGKIIEAALAEFFPNLERHDLEWRKTINACLHLLNPIIFNNSYPHCYNNGKARKAIQSLKVRFKQPISDDVAMVVDSYLNNRPGEVIPIRRDHMRILAHGCSRSAIPLKLYLLIAIRTIKSSGYARINQSIAARIFGCSISQVYRAQEFLIGLNLITKAELSPADMIERGVSVSIVK